jgi:hypothetical protein
VVLTAAVRDCRTYFLDQRGACPLDRRSGQHGTRRIFHDTGNRRLRTCRSGRQSDDDDRYRAEESGTNATTALLCLHRNLSEVSEPDAGVENPPERPCALTIHIMFSVRLRDMHRCLIPIEHV